MKQKREGDGQNEIQRAINLQKCMMMTVCQKIPRSHIKVFFFSIYLTNPSLKQLESGTGRNKKGDAAKDTYTSTSGAATAHSNGTVTSPEKTELVSEAKGSPAKSPVVASNKRAARNRSEEVPPVATKSANKRKALATNNVTSVIEAVIESSRDQEVSTG